MLNRLLGIKSLEKTEPVLLEEVDESLATPMPEEYLAHLEEGIELDSFTVYDPDGEEEEIEVDDGNA